MPVYMLTGKIDVKPMWFRDLFQVWLPRHRYGWIFAKQTKVHCTYCIAKWTQTLVSIRLSNGFQCLVMHFRDWYIFVIALSCLYLWMHIAMARWPTFSEYVGSYSTKTGLVRQRKYDKQSPCLCGTESLLVILQVMRRSLCQWQL